MKFEIIGKDDHIIKSMQDYEKFALPQGGEKQFKEGRSAWEFANYLIAGSGELPKEIEGIIKPYAKQDEKLKLYPEWVTSFGKGWGRGTGRHHDALLVGGNFVVGIEAKVDEPYGQKYLHKEDLEKTRYSRIANEILNGKTDNLDEIRYQLCSATLGTLMEAKENAIAILLVIVFKSTAKKSKLEKNKKDFEAFINNLQKGDEQDEYKPKFAADKKVRFFVKKIIIE